MNWRCFKTKIILLLICIQDIHLQFFDFISKYNNIFLMYIIFSMEMIHAF